jgi:hypothetical protein
VFLFILVALHLGINYYAVRGLALRQLNKQRAALAWLLYKANKKAPTPQQVASHEAIFDRPGLIRDPETHHIIGQYHVGSAPLDVLRGHTLSSSYLQIFEDQKYFICFDPRTSFTPHAMSDPDYCPIVHVCFQENFTPGDQLKGWLHAVEICRRIRLMKLNDCFGDPEEQVALIKEVHKEVNSTQVASEFMKELQRAGWNTTETYLMSGLGPKALLSTIALTTEKKPRT